jgi:Predicted Zn peptidase
MDQVTETPTKAAIGRRIQTAREARGLTQAQLAALLGIANHQTVSELEQGNRQLQPGELVRLTQVLERDLDYFVDPFTLAGEAEYSWRAENAPEEAIKEVSEQADRLVALLRWLRRLYDREAGNPLKCVLRLSELSTFEDAQAAGERLAEQLDLGDVPAAKLREKIQEQLDIPVLYVDTGNHRDVSGATVHLADFACILINRREPTGRRAFDLAHELFHALTWEAMPPKRIDSSTLDSRGASRKRRIEQLANNFATALLMPRALLEARIKRTDRSNPEQLCALAAELSVSPSALAWRLYNLNWIKSSTRKALQTMKSVEPPGALPPPYSEPFISMLSRALCEGRLSPRKAAKLLGLNLDELDELFRQYGVEAPY